MWQRKAQVAAPPPPAPIPAPQAPPAPAAPQGPLDKFQDKEEFTNYLASLAPLENSDPKAWTEAWNKIIDAVGPENAASAKDALPKVFSVGDQKALDMIYEMLVRAQKANPLNETFVGKIMENNPTMGQDTPESEPKPQQQFAGLSLPPSDVSVKTAATSAYPSYVSSGPENLRMCPKTRGVVNTYICRYHCLDGLAIDDHQVVCGEAIWRQSVMDKYSKEYRNAEGDWVGGYIEKRFVVEHDDGGHPALLKPGQRSAPIHEDAWSTEKRLQEMRRTESKDRGYCDTPGDGPKDLYNFDQHDLAKGPKANVSEKDKDKISKLAGFNLKQTKVAQNHMGNGMNEPSMLAGKECPMCKQKYSDDVMMCPRCNVQLLHKSKQQAQTETGGIPADPLMPSIASSDAVVHFANGVYRATKDGVSAYGADPVEARGKLDNMNNMHQENKDLLQLMDSDPTVALDADQPVSHVHPDVLDSHIDQSHAMMSDAEKIDMENAAHSSGLMPVDPTPTTKHVPVAPPVVDEIQGGQSHFKPRVQVQPRPQVTL